MKRFGWRQSFVHCKLYEISSRRLRFSLCDWICVVDLIVVTLTINITSQYSTTCSWTEQPFRVTKKRELVTPQCIIAWTKQNQTYKTPPPLVNHNPWLHHPKAPTVPSDDKSISTTTTQRDVIDNMNYELHSLQQQVSQLQQQLLTKTAPAPTPASTSHHQQIQAPSLPWKLN